MPKKIPYFQEIISVIAVIIVLWLTQGHHYTSSAFGKAPLTIIRADGTQFSFLTNVANTPQEQMQGLMFVKSMPPTDGMIFPYAPPQEVAFWMKNTLIPLDMLFIRADGTIGHIVTEARPEDVTPIPSEGEVIAVIELNGGVAKQDGLAVGDRVSSPAIKLVAKP
jgi:uncharacterized membrane protein (UPF0127 family)